MVEFPTGLLFAVAGMIGAPIGSMLADQIAEPILLGSFALLMIMIAGRMWFKSSDPAAHLPIIHDDNAGPTCRRDLDGRLRLTSQCAMLLGVVGLCSGILSGMFGMACCGAWGSSDSFQLGDRQSEKYRRMGPLSRPLICPAH